MNEGSRRGLGSGIGRKDRSGLENGQLLQRDESFLCRQTKGFGPIARAQLREDRAHVKFHRPLADRELGRDLFVASATRDRLENAALARGERRRRIGAATRRPLCELRYVT